MKNLESCVQIHRNIDIDKIQELEDTVEILTEQLETLKLELYDKNQELSEITEELNWTNHELCILNQLFTNNLASLPINEIEKLDNKLLVTKKPTKSNLFSPTVFEKIEV